MRVWCDLQRGIVLLERLLPVWAMSAGLLHPGFEHFAFGLARCPRFQTLHCSDV